MKKLLIVLAVIALSAPAFAGGGSGHKDSGVKGNPTTGNVPAGSPTRVQQLTVNLAYETAEANEEGWNTYHGHRATRLQSQLAAAIAAQNAGTPMAPVFNENGTVQTLQKAGGGVETLY